MFRTLAIRNRRALRLLATICLFATLHCAASCLLNSPCSAQEQKNDQAARVIKDIEFANIQDQSLTLDLYLPKETNNPPLVVWIHGGGWQRGNKSHCPIRWMTQEGFAVASISYRLTDKAIFPAQIHDCKAAIRWLRANKKKYGYSTERIAVAGASAGGMLAALIGTSGEIPELEGSVGEHPKESSRVDAVIDFYGPTDFLLRAKTQPSKANNPKSTVARLLGGPVQQKETLAALASAVSHVTSDDPPMLVFHGSRDKVVLPDQSERMRDVYHRAELPLDLQMIKGAGHGGKRFFKTPARRERMIRFLDKHLRSAE